MTVLTVKGSAPSAAAASTTVSCCRDCSTIDAPGRICNKVNEHEQVTAHRLQIVSESQERIKQEANMRTPPFSVSLKSSLDSSSSSSGTTLRRVNCGWDGKKEGHSVARNASSCMHAQRTLLHATHSHTMPAHGM